jgi:hypothetical protein
VNEEQKAQFEAVVEEKAKEVLIVGVGIAVGAIRNMVKDIKFRMMDIEAKAQAIPPRHNSYTRRRKKGRSQPF